MLNGEKVLFDVLPTITDGRTLVPLRAIFEALGAKVEWNGETQTITATKDDKTVVLTIGSNEMTVDGETKTLD
ncbi:MAG: copper amine oxidase N-terminal domain-containing protein, partial [Clostridia bacterium]|nr:copper amine oxidase N-terminal domain-containing protein [Clostridia bacterium]